jgi:hypothetical protein
MSMAIQGSTHSACAAHHASGATRGSRHRESMEQDGACATEGKRQHVRHALVEALSDALADLMPVGGSAGAASGTSEGETASEAPAKRGAWGHALHDFTRELFHALRPAEGEHGSGRHGRGFAWGRTRLDDIAQRLESLAQQIGGATTASVAASAASAAAATDKQSDTLPVEATTPLPNAGMARSADTAGEPSALLKVFQALASQRGTDTDASSGMTSAETTLAALLRRIAEALRADPAATAPATGNLVDTTA